MPFRFKIISFVLIAFIVVLFSWFQFSQKTDDFTLTILHFNDLHSMYDPHQDGMKCPEDNKRNCVGGVARLKTIIDAQRAASENVLLLNAGDNFQGSLYFSLFGESVLADVLNFLNIDAVSLGNHEFDRGDKVLFHFIKSLSAPIIDSNLSIQASSSLHGLILPYKVIDFAGVRIGIIGAVTTDTPSLSSPGQDLSFEDESAALTKIATELNNTGVNIIIAITHVGYKNDILLAQNVPYVDIIVGGHSETALTIDNTENTGRYPTTIQGTADKQVAVVQTKAYGSELGKLEVIFDTQGNIKKSHGSLFAVNQQIEPNTELQSYINTLTNRIPETFVSKTGFTTSIINGNRTICRQTACEVGNLVTDALLADHSIKKADVAIINSGSIRTSLPAGTITKGDILTALPFGNTVTFKTVTGLELITMFKKSISEINKESGAFLQFAGLQITYNTTDESQPPVITMTDNHNVPISLEQTYTLATNSYIAEGGDTYTSLEDNSLTTDKKIIDVVRDYLSSFDYYEPVRDTRLTDITEYTI